MEPQSSEGIDLRILGVNLGFENPSARTKKGGENLEGVLQNVPSNEEASQGEGLTSMMKNFVRSLKHTNVGKKKFIITNSQSQRY